MKANIKIKNFALSLRRHATKQETVLWRYLKNNNFGVKFRRQFALDNKYIVGFICLEKRLIIELDGGQHCENKQDKVRNAYLARQGFQVLRFWNNEIDNQLFACLEVIRRTIHKN